MQESRQGSSLKLNSSTNSSKCPCAVERTAPCLCSKLTQVLGHLRHQPEMPLGAGEQCEDRKVAQGHLRRLWHLHAPVTVLATQLRYGKCIACIEATWLGRKQERQ